MASVQYFKQVGVVNCAVGIKAGASPLSPFSRVWGIDKNRSFPPPALQQGFQDSHRVSLIEGDFHCVFPNLLQTFDQSIRIPTRTYSF